MRGLRFRISLLSVRRDEMANVFRGGKTGPILGMFTGAKMLGSGASSVVMGRELGV